MRSARTSMIRALVCEVSVTIPACEPVSDSARWPRSLITMAARAQEIRSPVERSMSISRGSGRADTSKAMLTSSSVVFPRAGSTAPTRFPASLAATILWAARLMRSASATEVPPNFITIVSGGGGWVAASGMAIKDSFGALATDATLHAVATRDRCPRRARGGSGRGRGGTRPRRRIVAVPHRRGPAGASAEPRALVPGAGDPVSREAPAGHRRAQPDRTARPLAPAGEEGGADDGRRVPGHVLGHRYGHRPRDGRGRDRPGQRQLPEPGTARRAGARHPVGRAAHARRPAADHGPAGRRRVSRLPRA